MCQGAGGSFAGRTCSEDHVPTGRMSRRKTKRSKTAKALRRPAATTAGVTTVGSSKKKIALLTRELSEALEQQAATGEILRVISQSHTDLQAVFNTIARSAVRLCECDRAIIFRFDGEVLRVAAAF